jgi:hypothetical protein
MPDQTPEELQERWVAGFSDLRAFAERGPNALISDQCRTWHSTDNRWITAKEALEAVLGAGEVVATTTTTYGDFLTTATEKGFICQTSMKTAEGTAHVIQVVTVKDGQVSEVMEYISPEMPFDFSA